MRKRHKVKHRKSKIQKTKEHYFKLYKSYKTVYCPALKANILFTNWGWNHLVQQKFRTSKEIEARLKIIPLGRKLLEVSTTIYRKRFQNERDHFEFKAWMGGVNVSVIVTKYRRKYYFLSVFRE